GELLMSEAITGSAAAWAYETTPDRRVYIGAGGQVFVFDPDEMSLDLIAVQPEGQSSIWDMESGEDGTVYFGSYPDGKLLAYAPDTDEWTDYGQQVEGNQYVRSLTVGEGEVFAGGMATPALTRVDVATGEISEIELPDGYEGEESVRDINLIEGLLFARISPINDVIVYDLAEEKWIDTIENVVGLEAAPAVRTNYSGEERTEVLLPQVGGDTVGFDLETQEQHEVPFDLGGAGARGWALQEFELDGFPGESLVTATSSATFFIWN